MAAISILIPIFLALPALAGVTGTEGGSCLSSNYAISAGGGVKMYYSSSEDIILAGKITPTGSKAVEGTATGQYPDAADLNGAYVAQGWIAIDHMEITPAKGYAVEDVIIDGKSKGAVSSYEFAPKSGTTVESRKHNIVVKFKTGPAAGAKSSCLFWLLLSLIVFILLLLLLILFLRKSRKRQPEDEEEPDKKNEPPSEG